MKSLPLPTSPETAIKVMCVANENIIYQQLGFEKLELVETKVINSKIYDVLHVIKNDMPLKLHFDVSGFYNKTNEIVLRGKDFPLPNIEYNLIDYFDFEFAKNNKAVNGVNVIFKNWTSNMITQYVMIPRTESMIESSVIREYLKIDGVEAPLLHGFIPLKLIAIHYLSHIENSFDSINTEIAIKDIYVLPEVSVDCLKFKPLEPFNYLNDFLNTIFYTHRPEAFANDFEILGVSEALLYGVLVGYFNLDEIEEALEKSEIDRSSRSKIIKVVKENL